MTKHDLGIILPKMGMSEVTHENVWIRTHIGGIDLSC